MVGLQRWPLQNRVALAGQSGFCSLNAVNTARMGSSVRAGASSKVKAIYFLLGAMALLGISDTSHMESRLAVGA